MPVALPIVPKVEFNFEVIMYITILFLNSKKLLSAIVVKTYLKALWSSCFRDDCRKKNFFTRKVCHHFFCICWSINAFCMYRQLCWSSWAQLSRFATKPVICSSLMIDSRSRGHHAVKMAFSQVCDIVTNCMCIYLSELWYFGALVQVNNLASLWNNQVSFIANISSSCDAILAD